MIRVSVSLLSYHALVFLMFTVIYTVIRINDHFVTSVPIKNHDPLFATYFSMVTHSTAGFGDCYARTSFGRLVVIMHLLSVLSATLIAWG